MESSVFEQGWVHIQTGLLGRRKKLWMVLTSDGLYTFKSEQAIECLAKISVDHIKHIEKKIPTSKKDLCSFKVSTAHKDAVFFLDNAHLLEKWVSELSSLVASANRRKKQDILSGKETILKYFQTLKDCLATREAELHALNKELTSQFKARTRKVVRSNTQEFTELERDFTSLEQDVPPIQRLQRLSTLSKPSEFQPHDLESQVSANINTRWLSKFIVDSTHIKFVNPNEFEALRSNITRALKWRYSGEKADAVSLRVSQNVRLTAVTLCRPYKPSGQTYIKKFLILAGNSTDDKPIYTHSKSSLVPYDQHDSTFKVKLSCPIILNKGQFYTALFMLDGDATYKCVDCRESVTCGQVTWQFANTVFTRAYMNNRTDVICGPIAGFQFQI